MNINILKSVSILFFLFISKILLAQEVPKLRIDPSQSYGGSASDYFDSVEYIPLETTKESLFGNPLYQIFTDSSFVIYDFDTRSILFFSLNGKYITKITERGRDDVIIGLDKNTNCVVAIVSNPSTSKEEVKNYSLMGKYLYTSTKNVAISDIKNKVVLGDGYVANANYKSFLMPGAKPKDSINHLIEIYKGDSLYNSFFPINQKENVSFSILAGYLSLPNVVQNGVLYVSMPLTYLLYKVTKDSVIKLYQFVFPENRSISQKIIDSRNPDILKQEYNNLHSSSGNEKIIDVSNIFILKNKLFFKINVGMYDLNESTDSRSIYNFIYDTTTHSLSSFERITPDTMTHYLPLFDNNIKVSGIDYNAGYFYSTVSSLKIFSTYEKNKSRNPQYPPVLQEYFKTQNRKSNPVIVKMKLKDF